jgi:hypothetical protein
MSIESAARVFNLAELSDNGSRVANPVHSVVLRAD